MGATTGTVTGVCVDSRQAGPGRLFFALKGENTDGHNYVPQALAAGAVAVVEHLIDLPATEKNNGKNEQDENDKKVGAQIVVPATLRALGDLARSYRQRFAIPIVGITGSVGKTSTKEMVAAILRTTYKTLASEKNYNNEIGVPLTLFRLDSSHEAAVIEMGMRGLGEIDYLAQIALPTIALITNIGHAHIERLGSRANIARAKSEIFKYLPENGIAILRQSDLAMSITSDSPKITVGEEWNEDKQQAFMQAITSPDVKQQIPEGRRILTFTQFEMGHADVRTDNRKTQIQDNGAVSFRVRIGRSAQTYSVALKAVGIHHVTNALAALTVAYAMNIPTERAIDALQQWEGAEGRMTVRQTSDNITVLDDCYNASPESMHAALETLVKLAPEGIAILGDMRELGEYARQTHENIGKICLSHAFRLIVVGEMAGWIADTVEDLRRGNDSSSNQPDTNQIIRFANAPEAAAHIRELVRPGDTILVKGSRAMEMEVIVQALIKT